MTLAADGNLRTTPGGVHTRPTGHSAVLAAAVDLVTEHLGAAPALRSAGWTREDAARLIGHLGRHTIPGSRTRDFSRAFVTKADGSKAPRAYRVDSAGLAGCQYAMLTHKQRAAVIVMDVDTPGRPGESLDALATVTRRSLEQLAARGAGPAWIGVNPSSGKSQAIWLIDPVYRADGHNSSSNWKLLEQTMRELEIALRGDVHFSHGWSRWPLYTGPDALAYRWHAQHRRVDRLGTLIQEVRAMTGRTKPAPATKPAERQFSSGWERIAAAQAAADEARMIAALDEGLPSAADAAADLIDGVRVRWSAPGRAARDETAFRHALAVAHRLRAEGKPMKDNLIMDAYIRAYKVAQAVGGDGREEAMPPVRDLMTMARRVRGYVVSGKASASKGQCSTQRQTSAGRKALATMGRRGGKNSAARKWANPEQPTAQKVLSALTEANEDRALEGMALESEIKAFMLRRKKELRQLPSTKEIAAEFGVSVARVKQIRKALGMQAPRGRPKKG
ncbi:replication initiation protein [Corynebacterium sp. CCM 9203]